MIFQTFPGLLVLLLWIAAFVALVMLTHRLLLMRKGSDRLSRLGGDSEKDVLDYEDREAGPFRRWLYLAGYRSKVAPLVFFAAAVVFFLFGMLVAWLLVNTGPIDALIALLVGGANPLVDIIIPLILILPYLLFLLIAAIPWVIVRAVRKNRVALIEQDMPVVLEILAALTEAGLSFDAAVDRLLRSHRRSRPLSIELGTYRADVEAGRKRSDALRRLADRVDVMSFSGFVSAVVLAEQTGGSLSRVLRDQAEYIRTRRRERAMAKALALPAKLVVPTVLCFVPAILVLALGPVYYSFLSVMDTILTTGGGLLMGGHWKLLNQATGKVVAEKLEVADSWLTRLRGLQFRSGLPAGHALVLVPCSSVHTHWMRFPIDVVMVDERAEITAVHENVPPWKWLSGTKKTHAVIEFPAKTAGVAQGDRFRIEAVDHSQPPPPESLRFLCA